RSLAMHPFKSTLLLSSALILLALPAAAQETREVETSQGAITIPAAPERVIVLNSSLAGSLYALGVDILAVSSSSRSPTEEGFSSVWAEEARAAGTEVLPDVGDAGFNYELLLSYAPDLIIGGGQGLSGGLSVEGYDQLSAIAPTLIVDSALDTWQGQIAFLAEALGRTEEADAAIAAYDARVAEVREAIALPPQPTTVLLPIENGLHFLPEASNTPQLFAALGFELDPLTERFPDFEAFGTGDSVEVSIELAGEVLTAPT